MQLSQKTVLRIVPLLVLALTASFGWAGEGGTDRPFKGYADSTSTTLLFSNPAPCWIQPAPGKTVLVYFDITYVGQATHMGKITRQEYAVLYTDGTFEGVMFFVSANGDTLVATFDGSVSSLAPPADGFGCYTFVGGTGRFSEASGETCFELYTPNFSDVFVTFDGVINY